MDQSLQLAINHGLPLAGKNAEDTEHLLLVSLTELEDADEASLVQNFQHSLHGKNVDIHSWRPSTEVLQAIAHQGQHRDSQTNLYAMGILAHRAGWTSLIVADELTKRQLKGTCRVGENSSISMVMIAIQSSNTQPGHEVRVVAKRTTGEDKNNAELMATMQTFEPQEVNEYNNEMFTNDGLVLHDTDRGVFTGDIAARLEWEECSIRGSTTEDASWAINHGAQPVALPSWVYHDNRHLNIFLMFPTAEDELANIKSTLQSAARKCHQKYGGQDQEMAIQLIPWEYHYVASRRGLLNLWDGYQQQILANDYSSRIYFLLEPTKDTERVLIGILNYDMLKPAIVSWISLEQVIIKEQRWGLSAKECLDRPKPHIPESQESELMYPPEQPFYVNNPPWLPADDRINWVPVFYLTSNLTKDQDQAVRAELHTTNTFDLEQWDKHCCFVPWKDGQRDGTLEDMWDIFWDVYTYRRDRATSITPPLPIFFIDQQSGHDLTVIAVDSDILYTRKSNTAAAEILKNTPARKVRGFFHGRLSGRDAHMAHANLSIANMGFDEFTEANQFPRPGWPGHGILEDDE
ncbi:uncharacterized protein ASPGLDRAFT_39395 [Aspergillus glaucus CBS 516.65]|uniref:Uncharacterized protein n=1 Tax=Aspergillus glaucus CBS 516.65 TaxID=1160497 RepID=A0A1L9V860_ASPGL|nr:hypothetical protein ASPGLDRAFT_39395 [Aspergillus glaucus CBS 516.65]OJJ80106.1 hypothetical protein ASPGLDRAFT_39395 [Aspergillus glaucus CBS 516.65]